MAWLRIRLTEEQQRVVNEERSAHPNPRIREKMLVLWLLHNGATRQYAADIVGVSRATVQRYVAAFREGGLGWPAAVDRESPAKRDGLLSRVDPRVLREATRPHCGRGLRAHLSTDRAATRSQPSAEIPQRYGPEIPAGSSDPCAAKKNLAEHIETQATFHDNELKPRLDAAQAGDGHVFFVDAAHFVFGTFLCCLWSFKRIFVRAASGRQRFNVLGAWDAVTRKLVAVTNTTVVNTETMCELLRKLAALGLTGPITLVLDNARYQRNAVVQALATSWESHSCTCRRTRPT